jgi:methylated-DNA-[protein]-cysteine S-methyltransferase
MTGRSYTIFDTGIGRRGIAWGPSGIIDAQLPEVREIDTRRRLYQLYPDARDLRPPQNVQVAIEGASPTTSKTLFDVLLPVAPPRAHT